MPFFNKIQKNITPYLFLFPALTIFTIVTLIPVIRGVYLAFMRYSIYDSSFVGLSNFKEIFADLIFWKSLWNAGCYTIVVVPGGMLIALLMSFMIFPLPNKSQSFYKAAFYLPGIASSVVLSMVWSWLYEPNFGLFNYLLSRIGIEPLMWLNDPKTALPSLMLMALLGGQGGSIILYLAAMGGIPEDVYEAACIDGANRWQQFIKITLPLLKPTTLYLAIMGIIGAFQVFNEIYMMTSGGPNNATITISYYIYRCGFEHFNFGVASAAAVVLFCLIVSLSVLQFKLFHSDIQY
jgi:multiple sugar transport system permease protein